jgi:hypothetical protein
MTVYKLKIDLPETMRSMVQEVQGVGSLVGITDQHLIVQVEADDRYDLGVIVCDLQSTMVALWSEPIAVMKPEEVK